MNNIEKLHIEKPQQILIQRRELAAFLGISISSLIKILEADRNFPKPIYLKGVTIGLYKVSDIKTYIENMTQYDNMPL